MGAQTVEKYRQAAIIAQNALSIVISELHSGIGEKTLGEVCRIGDEYIRRQVQTCFTKTEEKGVARPVEICKNDFVSGIAPEAHDTFQGGVVNEGDVLKVSLGVHIDGYTVMAGHTVAVLASTPSEPLVGAEANAIIGAYLATEAVTTLLASVLSENHALRRSGGADVRGVVEGIADAFGLVVVPGSRVRRIKRFVAGQPTVRDPLPRVEWRPLGEDNEKLERAEDEEFEVKPGQTYTIDIQMAPRPEARGHVKLVEVPSVGTAIEGPSVWTRDQTVAYQLRTAAARQLLGSVDKQAGVYPFKLSYLGHAQSINQLRLGVNECAQRHLLVGEPRLRAQFVPEFRPKEAVSVAVAREVATVTLVPAASSSSGYAELLRLSGGRAFPPSWTHSAHAVQPGLAADALNARLAPQPGLKYIEVKPTQRSLGATDAVRAAAAGGAGPAASAARSTAATDDDGMEIEV